MAKTADERLNDLEAKSVFQEDTIERLSNELRKQQQELIPVSYTHLTLPTTPYV